MVFGVNGRSSDSYLSAHIPLAVEQLMELLFKFLSITRFSLNRAAAAARFSSG